MKIITISKTTETNSNGERALEAIKLEAAQMAVDLGVPVQLRAGFAQGRIIDTFEPA